ncbi:MAG: L-serine ammonia-lyase [Bacteroides sp.]|nr:L-serine ammonia-lyase [Bacillota bacterium]MCM1455949.1 L-serine ammonia-lyase [Bacteroides sp.]
MKSLTELYKIGRGPSSSHTMGPEKACKLFEERNPDAASYKVILYGSLAQTGKGHGTHTVIKKTFKKPVDIVFDADAQVPHPNTLDLFALDETGQIAASLRVFSVGGGAIKIDGEQFAESKDVYPHRNFAEIKEYCEQENIDLLHYVIRFEGESIVPYLAKVWAAMQKAIAKGLTKSGVLPGGLNTERKAKLLYDPVLESESSETRTNRLVCAYAFAVAEQNASGGTVVTAPTCGACGILPAALYYEKEKHNFTDEDIYRALATAGIIGNVVKTNASISGAECGCQAECGTACSMAAAAVAELFRLDLGQIEYAAEVGMEHNLGLTCDPVDGLVQIPCIERNAVTAMRALNAVELATFLTPSHRVSFDTVVDTMYQTGKDLNKNYRETSEGGLAKTFVKNKKRRRAKKK